MYENIDHRYAKRKDIIIVLEVSLVYPYSFSFETLLNLCTVWEGIRIKSGGTNKEKANIFMTLKRFKHLFQCSPVKGETYELSGTKHFAYYFKVMEIII